MTDKWKPETFEIARAAGPCLVGGYVNNGLGLHMHAAGSPKGRRPANWTLSHLGTGHRLAYLSGGLSVVLPVATEIAEAGDWGFLSFAGYKDRFPDAQERLREIIGRHPKVGSIRFDQAAIPEVAQQIAANRP